MLEAPVQASVVKRLKKKGWFVIRLRATNVSGIPDLLALKQPSKVVFIECKRPGKKPTPKQRFIHKILRKLGFKVLVIDKKITTKTKLHI